MGNENTTAFLHNFLCTACTSCDVFNVLIPNVLTANLYNTNSYCHNVFNVYNILICVIHIGLNKI